VLVVEVEDVEFAEEEFEEEEFAEEEFEEELADKPESDGVISPHEATKAKINKKESSFLFLLVLIFFIYFKSFGGFIICNKNKAISVTKPL
jgi:hypothetical protein